MDMNDLADRVRAERRERKWTQQDLAREANVSLRTVSGFERREVEPQAANLRAMLHVLGIEAEAGDAIADETREEWPADVKVFLDVVGLFLVALPEDARAHVMHDVIRQIVAR